MGEFHVVSPYEPSGDQPKAIKELSQGVMDGYCGQVLKGVTGSGKTYTIAKVIEQVQKPTLVLAHNKTLAAQLCSEFREFFPDNAVEFFVSYYDYYRPEAYIPNTDTYIEKDSSVNDEIDKLRHSATFSLFERRDVIIVASVSCIYGLGDPEDYNTLILSLRVGMVRERDDVIMRLVDMQYERNDIDFSRGKFRVRGDIIEVFPSNTSENSIRVEFFGDEIDRITEIDIVTGEVIAHRNHVAIYPNSHYVTTKDKMDRAIETIKLELEERIKYFRDNGKLVEAQRIEQRTNYDIEMMQETGFCQGIENYSRHMSNRMPGSPPYTLIDYFPEDFLLVVDEAHVTIPQVRAMFAGDRSRKKNLIDFGFRLPSAYDNRPLCFDEFERKIEQAIYVSATPADYEKDLSEQIVEQIIRPTGLVDPEISVVPTKGQIDHLLSEINMRVDKNERVLVTTLTKRMAESLTDFLTETGVKVRYLHSDVKTIERMEIIKDLREGIFDVLVGINLLREGLDIPEVSLVAILDADKEGFLRSETSLIQTIGRAARNADGKVIMYADVVTDSMKNAIDETERRRKIQKEYNEKYGIVPKTIKKDIRSVIEASVMVEEQQITDNNYDKDKLLELLRAEMQVAVKKLEFEKAASIRDRIIELEKGN